MKFIFDTCSWLRLRDLHAQLALDLRPLLYRLKWCTNPILLHEFTHYLLDSFIDCSAAYVIPLTEPDILTAFHHQEWMQSYDMADQSILFCALQEDLVIVTDDGALHAEALSRRLKACLLPEFFLFLIQHGALTKNSVRKIFTYWEQTTQESIHDLKKWRARLNLIP